MPATLPPIRVPMSAVQRTTTAYSEESKRLHDLRADIMRKTRDTALWNSQRAGMVAAEETGIRADADLTEARALSDLAEARRRFVTFAQIIPVDADLPAVFLSEG